MKQKAGDLPIERQHFAKLIFGNPNYFGTLKKSPFKPIKLFNGNTTYEQLMCVGFQPQLNQLEAVVHIKSDSGYAGTLCSGGSTEYVRFYLSYDGGATWEDEGLCQFSAYDVDTTKPLEYAVTKAVNPRRHFCFFPNIIKVRAILSWNNAPTAGDPDFVPVWGNVLEANIQVEPRRFFYWDDFLKETKVQLPDDIKIPVEKDFKIPIPDPGPLHFTELHEMYKSNKDVQPHRYLFKSIQNHSEKVGNLSKFMGEEGLQFHPLSNDFTGLKIDISKIIDIIIQTDGDTSFEQLTCVGFDPDSAALIGIIDVKKSSGYSGGLCTDGSREYVAFWVDWGDGLGWTHEGTTSVRVHDIANIPAGGLRYAVFESLNLDGHRRRCSEPTTARVRAIMSWEVAPPSDDPNYVPTWGNREETTILIPPGEVDDYRPIFESVSSVPVCNIEQATGMTALPWDQPFGGVLTITGFIPNSPDISTPDTDKLRYRVQVRELPGGPPGAWQTVGNSFNISVIERIGLGLPTQYNILQEIQPDGYYIYREDMNVGGAGWRLVQNRVLAQWITAQPMTGLYEIKIDAIDPTTLIEYSAQSLLCTDGSVRTNVIVRLDEVAPTCDVSITGFSSGGGPINPIADCATVEVGMTIHGTYSVSDEHFGTLALDVEPAGPAHGAAVNPPSRSYPIVPTLGENGDWTLDTTGMDPCGYVVRLRTWDRTIVSSNGGWYCEDFVGFCLKAASS